MNAIRVQVFTVAQLASRAPSLPPQEASTVITDYCNGERECTPCATVPGCTWLYTARFNQHWLYVDDRPVASIIPRVGGSWIINVNRHREISYHNPSAIVPSVAFGRRMVERWVRVHVERLRRELALNPQKNDFAARKK